MLVFFFLGGTRVCDSAEPSTEENENGENLYVIYIIRGEIYQKLNRICVKSFIQFDHAIRPEPRPNSIEKFNQHDFFLFHTYPHLLLNVFSFLVWHHFFFYPVSIVFCWEPYFFSFC